MLNGGQQSGLCSTPANDWQDLCKVTTTYCRNPTKQLLVTTVADIIQGSVDRLEARLMLHGNLTPDDEGGPANQLTKIGVSRNIAHSIRVIRKGDLEP